jgi:hypothetical protein
MLSRPSRSSSAVHLSLLLPITPIQQSSHPSSQIPQRNSSFATTSTRSKIRRGSESSTPRPRRHSSSRAMSSNPSSSRPFISSSSSVQRSMTEGSPPPYTSELPETSPGSPFLARRSSSTPHLHSPPMHSAILPVYPRSQNNSRQSSSSTINAHAVPRSRAIYTREETDDDTDNCTSGDDAIMYQSPQSDAADSLRERLFNKGKARANNSARVRLISTAPGVRGAGETETESEETVSNKYQIQVIYHLAARPSGTICHDNCISYCSRPLILFRTLKKSIQADFLIATQPPYCAPGDEVLFSRSPFSIVRINDHTHTVS